MSRASSMIEGTGGERGSQLHGAAAERQIGFLISEHPQRSVGGDAADRPGYRFADTPAPEPVASGEPFQLQTRELPGTQVELSQRLQHQWRQQLRRDVRPVAG